MRKKCNLHSAFDVVYLHTCMRLNIEDCLEVLVSTSAFCVCTCMGIHWTCKVSNIYHYFIFTNSTVQKVLLRHIFLPIFGHKERSSRSFKKISVSFFSCSKVIQICILKHFKMSCQNSGLFLIHAQNLELKQIIKNKYHRYIILKKSSTLTNTEFFHYFFTIILVPIAIFTNSSIYLSSTFWFRNETWYWGRQKYCILFML